MSGAVELVSRVWSDLPVGLLPLFCVFQDFSRSIVDESVDVLISPSRSPHLS